MRCADEAWDALGIEVDGVDVSRGLLEGHLVPSLVSLAGAVRALASGRRRSAQVTFRAGRILLLTRRGPSVALSLVRLARPSRILMQGVEVEWADLARATVDSGEKLLQSLVERFPHAAAGAGPKKLQEALDLLRAIPTEGDPPAGAGAEASHLHVPPDEGASLAFGFDLRDDEGAIASYAEGDGLQALLVPGNVFLHGRDGAEWLSVPGSPFLLLRDLVSLALEILDPPAGQARLTLSLHPEEQTIGVDLLQGRLELGGRHHPISPREVARAILLAAKDFVAVLVGRNPLLERDPYLAALREESHSRLLLLDELARPDDGSAAPDPGPPIPTGPIGLPPVEGDLRRVSLLPRWRLEVGAIRAIQRGESGAWITHGAGCTFVALPDGGRRDFPDAIAVAAFDFHGTTLLLERGGALRGIDLEGVTRWERESDLSDLGWGIRRRDEAWLLGEGASLVCLDLASGRERFRLDPPAAFGAEVSASGAFLVLAADNGVAYAVDLDARKVAWRLPRRLGRVAVVGAAVVATHDGPSGIEILGIQASDRSIRWRTPLPVEEAGPLIPTKSGVLVPGATGLGGEVLHLSGEGAVRWRARPVLGPGLPSLALAGGTIFARGSEGACRIERGRARWSVPSGPGAAPVIFQGMVALPGERLGLLDAGTGREVLPPDLASSLPSADHVLAYEGGLLACDIHGSCAGLRVAGGLAVVG